MNRRRFTLSALAAGLAGLGVSVPSAALGPVSLPTGETFLTMMASVDGASRLRFIEDRLIDGVLVERYVDGKRVANLALPLADVLRTL